MRLKVKTFIIAAVTLDGFIGQSASHLSTRWTSKEDSSWFAQRTKEAKICVMGRKTYETLNRPLLGRVVIVQTRKPVDWQRKQVALNVQVSLIDSKTKLTQSRLLTKTKVWATSLTPEKIYQKLAAASIAQLAICGGASIYTQWLRSSLVDKLYLTVEPIIFGQGIKLFNVAVKTKLKLVNEKLLNDQGTKLLQLRVEH